LDAYQYFGTNDLYLAYLLGFLRAGGQFGAVMPALLTELDAEGSDPKPPAHLEPWWESEFCCFHGPEWWQKHWAKTGLVNVDHADAIDDGWLDWHRFNDATLPHATGWRLESGRAEKAMLEADQGHSLGFTRIAATKR
ncbi:MAG: SAM-dependent methyltransferase, partial [Actinomycetia bacterium]|nr:SAM-dependent methyltransferase [Actinomycetes bacterium]